MVVVRELDDGVATLLINDPKLGRHDEAKELIEESRESGERQDVAVVRTDRTEVVLLGGRRVRIIGDLLRLGSRNVVRVRDQPTSLVVGVMNVDRQLFHVDQLPGESECQRDQPGALRRDEEEASSPLSRSFFLNLVLHRSHGAIKHLRQIRCRQSVARKHRYSLVRVGLCAKPARRRFQER